MSIESSETVAGETSLDEDVAKSLNTDERFCAVDVLKEELDIHSALCYGELSWTRG